MAEKLKINYFRHALPMPRFGDTNNAVRIQNRERFAHLARTEPSMIDRSNFNSLRNPVTRRLK